MHFLIDIIFHEVCGWVGAKFLKIITFGRIDLDWVEGCSESILAEWTGLLGLVGLVLAAWRFRAEFLTNAGTNRVGMLVLALFLILLGGIFVMPGLINVIANWNAFAENPGSLTGRPARTVSPGETSPVRVFTALKRNEPVSGARSISPASAQWINNWRPASRNTR